MGGTMKDEIAPVVRFGMVTDVHYADIDPDPAPVSVTGRRFYRESKRKLGEAVDFFNARGLDFAIELGDFKDDTRGRKETLEHLEAIEAEFARFKGPRYHVAGNHDFDCLTPEEFFSRVPNDGKVSRTGYYSFVKNAITFIVLNACYDSSLKPYSCANPWDDANVPPEELAWFAKELAAAKGPVIVFCHQKLDDRSEARHLIRNSASGRALMEKSGKVKGVIVGHQHKGGCREMNGITYYTLRAMVCDSGAGANSFAEVEVAADGSFSVIGWRNADSFGAKGEFPGCGLIAHRGDSAVWPENTLPAFEAAVRSGAEMVELDEWRCKTGELVVIHDSKVDRTTNGKGHVADLTLAEIKALDAGVRRGVQFAGLRVPTMDEALACFPKSGIYLNIHCKTGSAAPEAADLLRRTGRLSQGVLMMDSRDELLALKAKCPWVKTGLVMNPVGGRGKNWSEEEVWRQIRDVAKIGVEFFQFLPWASCTAEQMRFLHDHGIKTTYYYANDEKKMDEIIAQGHDFVFTDRYAAMRPAYEKARRDHDPLAKAM
jgi:glycerophosphoryl diester phosphodiesterase